ncbi:D-aminoacyl-tRNA deacylase [Companilactobacillus sp. RD055328]|uniref:D-aminoacyl-tRNA deacylase n=1 Tax=Companilactobacillus sp. RD055328 TaxID=2916634 RepID=UPI001FC8E1BB|nr:D-aminoacyl-tRNA deacylase [Companilactobacillus sp. RD055328]GKQ42647.1 D-aminoacyl-tRNA deacylase [Companilactobacillus sp. RD055328]
MKLVIQRVKKASVSVDEKVVGEIDQGFCILVGIKETDNLAVVKKMAQKVVKLRIFSDDEGKMNLSVNDVAGEILSISQFTLYADTSHGNRPGFADAAKPDLAIDLYEAFNSQLRSEGIEVKTGKFGADMQVDITNDGPVTIVMEINNEDL